MTSAMESLSHAADTMQQLVDMLNCLNTYSLDQTPRDGSVTPPWPEISVSVVGPDAWIEKTLKNAAPDMTDKLGTAASWSTASTKYNTTTEFSVSDSLDQSFRRSFMSASAGDLDQTEIFRKRIRGRVVTSIVEGRLPFMLQETLPICEPMPQSKDGAVKEIEQNQMRSVPETASAGVKNDGVSLLCEESYTEQAKHVPKVRDTHMEASETFLPMDQSGPARRKVSFCMESTRNTWTSTGSGFGEALGCAAQSMQQLLKALKEALADSPEPSPRMMPPIALNRHETQQPTGYVELQAKQQQHQRQPSDKMRQAEQAKRQQPQDQIEQRLSVAAEVQKQECKKVSLLAEGPSHEIQVLSPLPATEEATQSNQQPVSIDSNASQACDTCTDVQSFCLNSNSIESINGNTASGWLRAALVDPAEENCVPDGLMPEESPQSNQQATVLEAKASQAWGGDVLRRRLESKPLKNRVGDSLRRRLRSNLIISIKENCPINVLWSDEANQASNRYPAGIQDSLVQHPEIQTSHEINTVCFRRRLRSKLTGLIEKDRTSCLFTPDPTYESESLQQANVDQTAQQMSSSRLSKVVTDVQSVGEDLQQLLGSARSAAASREQTPRTDVPATGPIAVDYNEQHTEHPELEESWLMPLLQHRMHPEAPPPKLPASMLQGFELASKYLDDLLHLLKKVDADQLDDTPRILVKPPTSEADGKHTAPEEVLPALAEPAPLSALVTAQTVSSFVQVPAVPAVCHAEVPPTQKERDHASADGLREGPAATKDEFSAPGRTFVAATEGSGPGQGGLRRRLRSGFLRGLKAGAAEDTVGRAFASEVPTAPTQLSPGVLVPSTESLASAPEVFAATTEAPMLTHKSLRHRLRRGFLQQLQDGSAEVAVERAFASEAHTASMEASSEVLAPRFESLVSRGEVLGAATSRSGQEGLRQRLRNGFLQQLRDGSAKGAVERAFASKAAAYSAETSLGVPAPPQESLISPAEVSATTETPRPGQESLRHRLRQGFLQRLQDGSAQDAVGRAFDTEGETSVGGPAAPTESHVSLSQRPSPSMEVPRPGQESLRHRLRHGFLKRLRDGSAEDAVGRAFANEAHPSPEVFATPPEALVSPTEAVKAPMESLRSAIQGDSLAEMLQETSLQEASRDLASTLKAASPPKRHASCETARLKLRSGLLGAVRAGGTAELTQATLDLPRPAAPIAAVAPTEAGSKHKQFLSKTERFLQKLEASPSPTPSAASGPDSKKWPQQTHFATAVSFAAARAARRFKKQAELGGETGQEGDGSCKSQSVIPAASASSLLCRRALLTLAEAIWDGRIEAPLEDFGWISGSGADHKDESAEVPCSRFSLDDDEWLDEIVAKRLFSPGKTDDEDESESEASTAVGTPRLSCMIPDLPSSRSSASTQGDLTSMIPDIHSPMASPFKQSVEGSSRHLLSSRSSESLQEADLTSMIPDCHAAKAAPLTQPAEAGRELTPCLRPLMPDASALQAAAQELEPSPFLPKPSVGARTVVFDGTKWIRIKSEPQLAPLPGAPSPPMQSAQLDAAPWGMTSKKPLATPGTLPSMPAGGAHHAVRWLAGTGDMNAGIGTQSALGSHWMQRKWL